MDENELYSSVYRLAHQCYWICNINLDYLVQNSRNMQEMCIKFLSLLLNLPESVIESLYHPDDSLLSNLHASINYLVEAIPSLDPDVFYQLLINNNLIKKSLIVATLFNRSANLSDALFFIYSNPIFASVYSYLLKHKLMVETSRYSATFTITQSMPRQSDLSTSYTVKDNDIYNIYGEFRQQTCRDDNLLVVGCNKSSEMIDISMFSRQNESERSLLLIIPQSCGIFLADLSEENLVAIRIKREPINLNSVFRLANSYFIAVTGVRCGVLPYLSLHLIATGETITFQNPQAELTIGKGQSNSIKVTGPGISNEHCIIKYEELNLQWFIEDLDSPNGLWTLIKNFKQFSEKNPSKPYLIRESPLVISIGPQKGIIRSLQ